MDLVEGESVSEDEVDGAFDVTIFVEMPPHMIIKRVLRAQKSAPDERSRVA